MAATVQPAMEAAALAGLISTGISLGGASSSQPGAWTPPDPAELAGVVPHLAVEGLIGAGAMGAVYRARQIHLDRQVALKILAPALGSDPAFAARFRREARVLARLDHPHIVRLHDAGESCGWLYLVLELVDGASLREVLRTGSFSPAEALRLAPQLCEALGYAHAHGVVHRDLKPENILVDGEGRLRIADFGLAKLVESRPGTQALTGSGQLLGTAAYMAPEQVAGAGEVDHRADLYSLGVVLYEMLTGHLPLGRFEPPSRQSGVDVRLDEVVLRALEREPSRRWQHAGELGAAMGQAVAPATATEPVLPALAARRPLPPMLRRFADIAAALLPVAPAVAAAAGGAAVALVVGTEFPWWGKAGVLLLTLFLLTPLMAGEEREAPRRSLRLLRRQADGARLFGICTGLAECTPHPAWAWRLAFLLALPVAGLGLLAYGGLWLALPGEEEPRPGPP
jgi:phage shock protein PspC (stress-responsive transcriptional regulator)